MLLHTCTCIWHIRAIPTYWVYWLYDTKCMSFVTWDRKRIKRFAFHTHLVLCLIAENFNCFKHDSAPELVAVTWTTSKEYDVSTCTGKHMGHMMSFYPSLVSQATSLNSSGDWRMWLVRLSLPATSLYPIPFLGIVVYNQDNFRWRMVLAVIQCTTQEQY